MQRWKFRVHEHKNPWQSYPKQPQRYACVRVAYNQHCSLFVWYGSPLGLEVTNLLYLFPTLPWPFSTCSPFWGEAQGHVQVRVTAERYWSRLTAFWEELYSPHRQFSSRNLRYLHPPEKTCANLDYVELPYLEDSHTSETFKINKKSQFVKFVCVLDERMWYTLVRFLNALIKDCA